MGGLFVRQDATVPVLTEKLIRRRGFEKARRLLADVDADVLAAFRAGAVDRANARPLHDEDYWELLGAVDYIDTVTPLL